MKLNTGEKYDISEKIRNAFGVKDISAKIITISGGIVTLQVGVETFHLREEIALSNLTKSYNLSAHIENEKPKKKTEPKVESVKPVVEPKVEPTKPVVEPKVELVEVKPIEVKPEPIVVKPIEKVETIVTPKQDNIKPATKPATIVVKPPVDNPDEDFM